MESEAKRRKLGNSSSSGSTSVMGRGCRGIFVTCDRNKESLAVKEVYRILENYIEERDGKKEMIEDLDQELAELSKKDKPSDFCRLDLGMKGITFVQILKEGVSPTDVIKQTIQAVKQSNTSRTRYAARLIPAEWTCYAHYEDVLKILQREIPRVFTNEKKGCSGYNEIKRRNNDVFDKESLIHAIGGIIDGSRFPVCLRDGNICIHIDINKGVAGLAIIEDWKELNDLSFRTLLDEKKPKEKKTVSTNNVNAVNQDWKCGSCGAPNYMDHDECWKCHFNRLSKQTEESISP